MPPSYGTVSHGRKIITPAFGKRMALSVAVILSSIALVSIMYMGYKRNHTLLEKINGLELNAYFSASQVEKFHSLLAKQSEISAGIAGLLEREREMKPEDTKVRTLKTNFSM
jgi:hypothetical protein